MKNLFASKTDFRSFPTLTAMALTLVIAFGSSPSAMAQNKEDAAVRDALLSNAAAFEKGDMSTLSRVWANDESVTVFESGHANYGWADYRDNHLKPEMAEMKNVKYSLTDIKPHIAGNTAWATFKFTISADVNGRQVNGEGLGTAVLEKREGRWQIVHWHSSSPRRAPAAKSEHK